MLTTAEIKLLIEYKLVTEIEINKILWLVSVFLKYSINSTIKIVAKRLLRISIARKALFIVFS